MNFIEYCYGSSPLNWIIIFPAFSEFPFPFSRAAAGKWRGRRPKESSKRYIIKLMPGHYGFFPQLESVRLFVRMSVGPSTCVCQGNEPLKRCWRKGSPLTHNEAIRRQWRRSQLSRGINHIRPYSGRFPLKPRLQMNVKENALFMEFLLAAFTRTYAFSATERRCFPLDSSQGAFPAGKSLMPTLLMLYQSF